MPAIAAHTQATILQKADVLLRSRGASPELTSGSQDPMHPLQALMASTQSVRAVLDCCESIYLSGLVKDLSISAAAIAFASDFPAIFGICANRLLATGNTLEEGLAK